MPGIAAASRESRPALVADVGGTNTRMACARDCAIDADSVRRFRNGDFPGLESVIRSYGEEFDVSALSGACIAVAGPVANGRSQLTNIDWTVDARALAREFGQPATAVINDLQAVGHALHHLRDGDVETVVEAGQAPRDAARLVINAGTGFNAVAAQPTPAGIHVAPSECGHAGMPVTCEEDFRLKCHLESRFGFASIEDVLSGQGLDNVKSWVGCESGTAADYGPAADSQLGPATAILVRILAAVASDLALVHLPFGGVFLTGGVVRALVPDLIRPEFAQSFRAKGRFTELVGRIPVHLIRDDLAPLRGCAIHLQRHTPPSLPWPAQSNAGASRYGNAEDRAPWR